MINQTLFQQALPVLQTIEKNGFEAYFVGGCVRDALLGKPISDVDIATNAFPFEIKRMFPKTIDIGIEHGTVMVLYQKKSYEITTFRVEDDYQDFRRPSVVTFVRHLHDDLKRRDFTINALAMDSRGKLYDFHNGQEDMNRQIIRAVGDPNERFNEDALRMMRAVRFVAQLNFNIDIATFLAIQDNAHLLQKIAVERIKVEFDKLLMSSARNRGLALFIDSKLYIYCPYMEKLLSGMKCYMNLNIINHTVIANWASLLYLSQMSIEHSKTILKAWKMSNKEIDSILKILNSLYDIDNNVWSIFTLFDTGYEIGELAEQIYAKLHENYIMKDVKTLYNALPIKSLSDIAINGYDIMKILNQSRSGAYIGRTLQHLKTEILLGHLKNDKKQLLEWVKQHVEVEE